MKVSKARIHSRRKPRQERAQETVQAVLDAVGKILKNDGIKSITTNRIAKVAGVSIGSLYQYFPDKLAIFTALHARHIQEIDRLIEAELAEHSNSPLSVLVRALVEAMIEAHATEPELYRFLFAKVPHRADGTCDFSGRLHNRFRVAFSARIQEVSVPDLDTAVSVFSQMIESLSHGAVLQRPASLSLEAAREEAIRAVLGYLRSPG